MSRRAKLFLFYVFICCSMMYGVMGFVLEQFDPLCWPEKIWVVFIVPSFIMLSFWPLLGIVEKPDK